MAVRPAPGAQPRAGDDQYLVTTDGPAHLSPDGRAQVADIRRQADEAVDAGLPYDQLDARLHDLADQFKAAIVADLQTQAEHPHGGRDEERVRTDGDKPG